MYGGLLADESCKTLWARVGTHFASGLVWGHTSQGARVGSHLHTFACWGHTFAGTVKL